MTIFTKKLIIILLPIFTLVIIFELLARAIPTSYKTKHNNLMNKKDQLEILVLGSSHANFGIDPQYFGRAAFNISNTSQCLYQDYNVLLKYLPECKNVKMVIVPISYFTLQTELALSPEAWRCMNYSVYMGVKGDESHSVFDLRYQSALVLWDGPIGVIRSLRKNKKLDINEYGYQAPDKSKKDINEVINDSAGEARVQYHDKIMKYDLLNYNIVILNKLIDELKKRNIKIVFVTTPVYKTYYQHISKKNYETMINVLNDISQKKSVTYFNYFNDNRFEINDFMDNDHLNNAGAKKFSVILKNEVIDKGL